jgi:iron complex transport system substrate-binding protein
MGIESLLGRSFTRRGFVRSGLIAAAGLACGGSALGLSGCGSSSQASARATELAEALAAGSDTARLFTDDSGREVAFPAQVDTLVPSGAYAQLILATLCPDKFIALSSGFSTTQKKYFPESLTELPVFGRYYGKNADMNYEYLIDANPDVLLDAGTWSDTMADDMQNLQDQVGIPCAFVRADTPVLATAYRRLGEAVGCEARAEELASYIDRVFAFAAEHQAEVAARDIKVLYSTGAYGYQVKESGGIHAYALDMIGLNNVAVLEDANSTEVSPEQVLLWQPDVVLLSQEFGFYDSIWTDGTWTEINAVKNKQVYEVPYEPYEWLDRPPSVQLVLGLQWLGNLLCPDIYDYDMVDCAREFFSLFWNYDLSVDEAKALMENGVRV